MNRTTITLSATLAVITLQVGAAGPPAQQTPREKVYGALLEQESFKNAMQQDLDSGVQVVFVVNALLSNDEILNFRQGWDKNYRKLQGTFAGTTPEDPAGYKATQQTLFRDLTRTLKLGSDAAAELAEAKKWDAWLLVTRGLHHLAQSIPTCPSLKGIEQGEAGLLKGLRLAVHESLKKRRKEWYRYLQQAEQKLDPRVPIYESRVALDKALNDLLKRETDLTKRWKEHLAKGGFPTQWDRYFSEYETGRRSVLVLTIKHTASWKETKKAQDTKTLSLTPPIVEVRAENRLAWPYILASRLGLGNVKVGYDTLGYDGGSDLPKSILTIVPRIRLRGIFEVKEETLPSVKDANARNAITALDLRLIGKPLPLRALGSVPMSARPYKAW
jgi:hypothetical protein